MQTQLGTISYTWVVTEKSKTLVPREDAWPDFVESLKHTVGAKRGAGFVPATFTEGAPGRKTQYVESLTALVLDIDKVTEDEFDSILEAFPYFGVWYTTASHSPPKKICARLVLPFTRPVSDAEFVEIWQWAYSRSQRRIDKQCSDLSRLYYYPRVPESPALDYARVVEIDGPLLDPESCVIISREDDIAAKFENALHQKSRNEAFFHFCRYARDAGYSVEELQPYAEKFVAVRGHEGDHPYTIQEAESSIRSVYTREPAEVKTANIIDGYPFKFVAKMILDDHPIITTGEKNIYEYAEKRWTPIAQRRVRNLAFQKDFSGEARPRNIEEVVSYLLSTQHQLEVPRWNRGLGFSEIPLKNGVLDVATMRLRDHRMSDWIDRVFPHSWDGADKPCSLWMEAMLTWFGDGSDGLAKMDTLQEFFGYCLLSHCRAKKALVLKGDKDTGKSIAVEIIQAIVGGGNHCGVPLQDMDDPKRLYPIRGAALNAVSELSKKSCVADGGFKALVAGDAMQLERKFADPEMYSPTAKVVVATNNLPRVTDMTDATFGRLIIIEFKHQIASEDQDKTLPSRLKDELSGIVTWAIRGAERLVKQQWRFTEPASSVAAVAAYKSSQNSVAVFMEQITTRREGSLVLLNHLRDLYQSDEGVLTSKTAFTQKLHAAGYETKREWVPSLSRKDNVVLGVAMI